MRRQRHPVEDVPRRDDGRVDVDRCVAALSALDGTPPVVLESAPDTPHTGRYSYVVAADAGHLRWSSSRHVRSGVLASLPRRDDPFAAVDDACRALGLTPDADRDGSEPPFTSGLAGVFGYDLARSIERLPSEAIADRDDPDLHLTVAAAVLVIDHVDESAAMWVTPELLADGATAGTLVARVEGAPALAAVPAPSSRATATTSLPHADYLAALHRVLEHIRAGDTFQVNLTQRLTAPWKGDLYALYRSLRRASAAPYGAVVATGPRSGVASISPETFLHAEGRRVETRPIKGTRPRHDDPAVDLAAAEALAASAKDRAENVMVVDMERNDLGRVCRVGSVRVPELLQVEAHPTVWHLVSTVTGELREDVGWADLLRAAFPCGSVTGTPKVRAMRIIDELEPVRRGWYCGAIGFLAPGAISTSVAIRTATLHDDATVDYGAGGGIVADSDPEDEWRESLDKAVAFLRAVGADEPA